MRKFLLLLLLFYFFIATAAAMENKNSFRINLTFNIGSFSAGEYDDGSVFLGASVSFDFLPNRELGLSYGIETGLPYGKTKGDIIYGIPLIFRLGWHPSFLSFENFDVFVLAKAGWGFGIWGNNLDEYSTPGGVIGGFNFGGNYYFSQNISVYAEAGYNYYGLARNSNYPEYPLGYGSGKIYTSLGLSYRL